jgi:hypothetical protein
MTSCGSSAPARENGRPDWGRAADGIFYIGIAVFLLLNTTGALPWSFWLDAIPLWPLLIASAGAKMAFERTRMPWLVLLGPAIVLGGLAWAATGVAPEPRAADWKSEGPLPRPEGAQRVKLALKLVGSRIQVEGRELEAGALADASSIERVPSTRLEVKRDGDTAELRLDTGSKSGIGFLPGRRQRWQLGVPTELPVAFDLNGALVRSRFDLTKSRVEAGEVNGVFLATTVALPATPQPVKLRLRGVFNLLRVSVPEGTPVRVEGTGFPFNLLKRRVVGDASRPGYEIKLDGIFSAVAIDVRKPPKRGGEPPAEAPAGGEKPPAEAPATPEPPAVKGEPTTQPT